MDSPITPDFVRAMQPLPPSDRRAMLKELAVAGIDPRDDGNFYEWLAERYRRGEAAKVDAALQRCCAKADERIGFPRFVAWLAQQAGWREPPSAPSREYLVSLRAAACGESDDTAAIVEALAINRWFGDEPVVAAAMPVATPPLLDAAAVASRLDAALRRLAATPDFDLLLRADTLAEAIERHLDQAGDRAERAALAARVEIALACLDADAVDRAALDLERADLAPLRALAEAAEATIAVGHDVAAAQAALGRAATGTRAESRAAFAALDEANDRLDLAEAALRDAVAAASPESGTRTAAPPVDAATPPAAPMAEAAGASVVAPLALAEAADAVPVDAASVPADTATVVEATPPPPSIDLPADPPAGLTDNASDEAAAPMPETAGVAEGWDRWIDIALTADRVGLAFHLASARDLAGGAGAGVPAAVIEGVLHGRATRAPFDSAWQRYDDLRDPLMQAARSLDGAAAPARVLLLMAGTLHPALAQSVLAEDVLAALQGDMAAQLNPLTRALTELRAAGVTGLHDIAAPAGTDERRQRAAAARADLTAWQRDAATRKTNYGPATLNWHAMVAPDGVIGRVVASVLARAADAQVRARVLADRLADRDETERLIAEVDAARSGRRYDEIEGAAKKRLLNLCGEVADLLNAWLRVEGAAPATGDRHRARRATLLRELTGARQVALAAAPTNTAIGVAATVFVNVADRLASALAGEVEATPWTADDELALLPAFALNGRANVRMDPDDAPALAAAARAELTDRVPTPDTAFTRALTLQNASAAGRLLAHLPAAERPAAEAQRAAMIEAARDRVAHRAVGLRQMLDDLQIAWDDPDRLPDAIEREMRAFEEAPRELPLDDAERGDLADFPAAHRRLDDIERKLRAERAPVAARLEQAIVEQEAKLSTTLTECRDLLAQGDLGTLAESVTQVRKHGQSPSRPALSVELLQRFAATVTALGEQPSIDLVTMRRAAAAGQPHQAFDFARLPEQDRARADALLSHWMQLKRVTHPTFRGDSGAEIRTAAIGLFTALGFTGVRVAEVKRERALWRLSISTDPLRDRGRCLVPAFGSDAVGADGNGRYIVFVVPDGGVSSALGLFDQLPEQVVLLATKALPHRFRRDLQRAARAGTRSVAVADMVTAAVLASEPEASTRAFFDLALPFGAARPYADTSAQTSLEMFFGREREYRALVDPMGACLVYGGRQLGKTALLKQIELRENIGADRIAVYCDIVQIGDSRPAAEVWLRIDEELRRKKIELPPGRTVPDRLRAWVDGGPGRYLLILLDEADHFLDGEMAAHFEQIGRMKALMDETRRGVKFVLAGLHNVQRFHRAPNSPFLHLGKSVNVGPLLGEDREAAREMALEPMAALGIAFDKPVDAAHMLSLVGFYPSLMQSFGKAVVEAVDDRLKQPGDSAAMPFALDRKLIGDCFEQQAFREGVVNRFQKTLQLDERYELITYAVWQRAMQDVHEGKPAARGGYPASVIRDMADYWWAAGFRDTDSPDSFAAILDEMVEMGVLAREGERYALRSQRIAAMLGSKAEIEDALESFGRRVPKKRADPMTSHRRTDGVWSPMSLRQEATLRERLERGDDPAVLTLIGAAPAAGRDDLFDAIGSLAAMVSWPVPRQLGAQRVDVVLDVVRSVRNEARPGRPKLVVLKDAWPDPTGLQTLRRHRLLRDADHPVRVVYCGAPRADVLALPEDRDWWRLLLGPLPLTAMGHWLHREGLGFAGDEAVQRALREATGGFIGALDTIKRPPPGERHDPAPLLARAGAALPSPAELGLDGALEPFARDLRELIGSDPLPARELEAWVAEQADGPDRLRLLRALGVIEPVEGDGGRHVAFNPAAFRALA